MTETPIAKLVPGAGENPAKVCRPGKRLRNWVRRERRRFTPGYLGKVSLREAARFLAAESKDTEQGRVARDWLANKGIQP